MFETNRNVFNRHVKISSHLGRKHFYGSDGEQQVFLRVEDLP